MTRKLENNMSCKKYILISVLCQLAGMLIGMALGLGLVALVWKIGWMEKFL